MLGSYMNLTVRIPLQTDAAQHQRLLELQREFARACNAVAPLVQETRIWNRVALHHLAYRKLRESFPGIGSQMACNAIYSVSRAARLVFQTPGSPFHHSRLVGQPLPRLHFLDTSPVYFDRHTLSLKQGQASMYTLDGRMRFQLALSQEQEEAFHQRKLLEAALLRGGSSFELHFIFAPAEAARAALPAASVDAPARAGALRTAAPRSALAPGTAVPQPLQEPASARPERMPEPPPVTGLPPYLSIEAPA